jgi:hypothetical protein
MLANREYAGNLSALVTDLAEEARRRMAAGDYLRRHQLEQLSSSEADSIEREIAREVSAWRRRRKKNRAA